jgi:phage gp29-like protein
MASSVIDLTGLDSAALRKTFFSQKLPRAEQYRTYFGRMLDQGRIENALRQADLGLMVDLCDLESEALSLDPHLSGVLGKRIGSIKTLDWSIVPASGPGIDKRLAAEIANEQTNAYKAIPNFMERLYDLEWAIYDGRAAQEIHWAVFAGRVRWRPVALSWLHPRRLSFGSERELRVIDTFKRIGNFQDLGFPIRDYPGKFLWWQPRMWREYPEREGIAPRTLYWTFFKRFDWRMRMALTEIFGLPWRIVETDKDAPINSEQLDAAEIAAEKLGQESTAAFGPGQSVKIVTGGEHGGDLMKMTSDDVDLQMSKLVLGQTGTTDATGNRAESIVMKSEQDILLQSDAAGISCRIHHQLDIPFVALNWGESALDHAGTFTLNAQPQRDRKTELERVEKVLSFGVPVPLVEVREIAGFRAPEPDEPYLVSKPGGTDALGNPLPQSVSIVDPEAGELEAEGLDGQADRAAEELAALARMPLVLEHYGRARAAHDKIIEASGITLPFGKWEDFDSCVADHVSRGHSEDSARRICGAIQEKVEGIVRRAEELSRTERALPMTLAAAPPMRAPGSIHGAPSAILERELGAAEEAIRKLADRFVDAVPTGESSAPRIRRAIDRAFDKLPLDELVDSLERTVMRSAMLGALDSEWEARADDEDEKDKAIAPATYSRVERRFTLAVDPLIDSFVTKPFSAAVDTFIEKKIVTPDVFERLSAAARRRAFTVAGMTSQSMLEQVHFELAKSIGTGGDLRDFRATLSERLRDSGWLRPGPREEAPTRTGSPWHVETIFRNATAGSYASGRDAHMRQPAVIAKRPYWQVLTVSDDRRRPTHGRAHGKVLRHDDPFWTRAPLPWGHNCFLPTERIEGRIIGASRALYSGKAIEITTRKGRRLSVTAKHPVLTAQGFAIAQSLREGMQLVCDAFESRGSSLRLGAQHNEYQQPTVAQDVFGAFVKSEPIASTQPGSDDFHGEAECFHGHVEIVGSYRQLLLNDVAARAQQAGDLILEDATFGHPLVVGASSTKPLVERLHAASSGNPSGSALALDATTIKAQRGPLHVLRLGAAAQMNAVCAETIGHGWSRDVEFIRELFDRDAGLVSLDEIVDVREFDFLGHVFDFESETGLIVASGIVTSNCRCRKVSRSDRDVERLGLTISDGSSLTGLPDPGWDGGALG